MAMNPVCYETTTPKSSPESIVPAIHLESIQNHLQNPTASGLESVEQYHWRNGSPSAVELRMDGCSFGQLLKVADKDLRASRDSSHNSAVGFR